MVGSTSTKGRRRLDAYGDADDGGSRVDEVPGRQWTVTVTVAVTASSTAAARSTRVVSCGLVAMRNEGARSRAFLAPGPAKKNRGWATSQQAQEQSRGLSGEDDASTVGEGAVVYNGNSTKTYEQASEQESSSQLASALYRYSLTPALSMLHEARPLDAGCSLPSGALPRFPLSLIVSL